MKILAIDTSCDETSAAVTDGTIIISNVIWSQASLHANFGGVYPSLAKRAHEERIDYIIGRALRVAFPSKSNIDHQFLITNNIDAIAVTIGPGLAIALEVGINKAKELATKFNKPLIPINHIEGHVLSSLAMPRTQISNSKLLIPKQISDVKSIKTSKLPSSINLRQITFPALSLVVSGKHTDLILINKIGKYELLASTMDDALGEALDKSARMMGLGYPGGPILEEFAKDGNPLAYTLPVPLIGHEGKMVFSYSGLKTAMYKLVENQRPLTKNKINNLSASFQNVAFKHVERVLNYYLTTHISLHITYLLFGGGVSANIELRKRLRIICNKYGIKLLVPYSKKLCTDNAAMVGVSAGFKFKRKEYLYEGSFGSIERLPRWKVDEYLPEYNK